jgi:hypothetical protein
MEPEFAVDAGAIGRKCYRGMSEILALHRRMGSHQLT